MFYPISQLSFGRINALIRPILVGGGIAALIAAAALPSLNSQAAPAAQTAAQVVTIAVPPQQIELYNNTIIPIFEKGNPNIIVQAVAQTVGNTPPAATNVGNFLDAVQSLTSQADVVFVSTNVTAESTRAGYFLNLQPLIDTDQTLNQSDFFPSVVRAFQWDQGTWALPISLDATVLTYDPAAFDKAGVNYPTPKWTLTDLITAATKLTITNQSSAILTPGLELFQGNNDIPLYMSLLGQSLADTSTIPNAPNINQPNVQALLDNLPNLFAVVPAQSPTFGQAPIQIGSIRQLTFGGGPGNNAAPRKGILLPGGHSYLTISGVAVSSATQQPEAAYALAKFLTTRTDVGGFGGSYPARQSLLGQASSSGGGGPGRGNRNLTPEVQQLYNDAIANGYTAADRRFFDFLGAAITDMRMNKTDSKTAIANAQTSATQSEQTALVRKNDLSKVAVVATPVPTLAPNAGITLKFGISGSGGGGGGQIQNLVAIQSLADQFVKQNTGVVGRISLEVMGGGFGGGGNSAASFDCYYLPYSNVSNMALDSIVNLDPYLTADPNFNKNDYIGGVLSQVSRDNKIWALPMNIQPTVMWYDPKVFANAGIPLPASGWDMSAFNVALTGLKPFVTTGNPPFSAQADTGSTLLMLVAAYGGLPIDFRTNPMTVNFTDKANVDAMQQVLDLAKSGMINYQALADNRGFFVRGANGVPVYSQQLSGNNFRGQQASSTSSAASNYVAVTFPKGTSYQLMAYSVGTLYINATAQNADSCYRWISLFAQHPELTNAMPTRNSQLNSPTLDTAVGKALAQAYRDSSTVLNDPKTIGASSLSGGIANPVNTAVQHWLFQAWDSYVLNGQDLATGLAKAQQFSTGFLTCYAAVPAFDPAQEKYSDYLAQVDKCVTTTDPTA